MSVDPGRPAEMVARMVLVGAIGVAIGVVLGAAIGIHAQELPTDETIEAAAEAGVDPLDLQGALNTTGLDPRSYLIAVGELAAPVSPPPPATPASAGWPFGGAIAQRIYCAEAIESRHGAAMYNPQPWHGEHAQGWLGFLPSTARRWGVVIGNRASEWAGARRMLLAGAGGQFYGIAAGLC